MNKMTFVSNPNICIYKMYYSENIENESVEITPDQIPEILLESISAACNNDLILGLKIFIDMTDDSKNYVHAIITVWDGITAVKRGYELYGDGSYNRIEGSLELL